MDCSHNRSHSSMATLVDPRGHEYYNRAKHEFEARIRKQWKHTRIDNHIMYIHNESSTGFIYRSGEPAPRSRPKSDDTKTMLEYHIKMRACTMHALLQTPADASSDIDMATFNAHIIYMCDHYRIFKPEGGFDKLFFVKGDEVHHDLPLDNADKLRATVASQAQVQEATAAQEYVTATTMEHVNAPIVGSSAAHTPAPDDNTILDEISPGVAERFPRFASTPVGKYIMNSDDDETISKMKSNVNKATNDGCSRDQLYCALGAIHEQFPSLDDPDACSMMYDIIGPLHADTYIADNSGPEDEENRKKRQAFVQDACDPNKQLTDHFVKRNNLIIVPVLNDTPEMNKLFGTKKRKISCTGNTVATDTYGIPKPGPSVNLDNMFVAVQSPQLNAPRPSGIAEDFIRVTQGLEKKWLAQIGLALEVQKAKAADAEAKAARLEGDNDYLQRTNSSLEERLRMQHKDVIFWKSKARDPSWKPEPAHTDAHTTELGSDIAESMNGTRVRDCSDRSQKMLNAARYRT